MLRIITISLIFLASASEVSGQAFNEFDFRAIQNGVSLNYGNLVFGSENISTGALNAVIAFEKFQERADQLYADKDYKKAYELYLELARFNDKFSQYRISVMYLYGRGVQRDLADAYAWSYISAEARQKGFVNNHVYIRNLMTPEQLRAGKIRLEQYHDQYGTFAIASEARQLIRREKRQCTGSRLGTTCDGVAAFGTNCGITSEGQLSRSCLVFGSVGLPGIASLQPVDLRTVETQLELMIDHYNPGFIELGDLEIIED